MLLLSPKDSFKISFIKLPLQSIGVVAIYLGSFKVSCMLSSEDSFTVADLRVSMQCEQLLTGPPQNIVLQGPHQES